MGGGDNDPIEQNPKYNNLNGLCLQLTQPAMACYPFPYLQMPWELCQFKGSQPVQKHPKRLKQTPAGGGLSTDTLRFRDHILTYTQRYMAAEAVEEAIIGAQSGPQNGDRDGDLCYNNSSNEIRLVYQLIACSEAVACRDRAHAMTLLSSLNAEALVFGSSFQRVASCFAKGLSDRLSTINPLAIGIGANYYNMSSNVDPAESAKKTEALRLVYDICPHIRFGHFVANRAILEAFEEECSLHVVDLGLSLGLPCGPQWRDLLVSLAARDSHAPVKLVKITAVGLDESRFREIGNQLGAFANTLGVPFEFNVVKSTLENLKKELIPMSENECLVINSVLQLHCVVKESRGALNSVLQSFHELKPKTLVLVEQDSNHNGPFFLGRFMEALHYYSAIFDSLDAMLPKYDTKRAKIEQFYFAEEIRNIVSFEGSSRVERHERVDQWRRRMSRAGFQAAPVKMAAQERERWLGESEVCEGYTVVEEKGCLVLGWKSRPIVAVSCWKC